MYKSSFVTLRFAIQHKIKALREQDFDTIHNHGFNQAKEIFKAQSVLLKKQGLCQVSHYSPICEEDLRTLYKSDTFCLNTTKSLQRKVFFDIIYYFCWRGRENLRELTKYGFEVRKNKDNTEYVVKVSDELSKNHRESDKNEDSGIMMATGEDACPVKSFKCIWVS